MSVSVFNHPLPFARTAPCLAAILALGSAVPARADADPTHPHWMMISPEVREPGPVVLTKAGGRPCLVVPDAAANQVRRVYLDDGTQDGVAGHGQSSMEPVSATAAEAIFSSPRGLAQEPKGDFIVADTGKHRIVRITRAGRLERVGGNGFWGGTPPLDAEGKARQASQIGLDRPTCVAPGPDGTLYFADSGNFRILTIGRDGKVRPVAGTGEAADEAPAGADSGDATPLAAETPIGIPTGLVVGPDRSLTFSTARPGRIWRIDGDGRMALLMGPGRPDGAPAHPASLAPGEGGTLYFADLRDNRLFRRLASGALEAIQLPTGEALLTSVSTLPHGGLVVTARGQMWITFPGRDDGHPSGERLARLAEEAIEAGLAGHPETLEARLDSIRRGEFAKPAEGDRQQQEGGLEQKGDGAGHEGRRSRFRSMAACLHVQHQIRRRLAALAAAPERDADAFSPQQETGSGEPGAESKARPGKRKREAEAGPEEPAPKEQRTASQADAEAEAQSGESMKLHLSLTPQPESQKQEPLSRSQSQPMAPPQDLPEILAQDPNPWNSL